MSSIDIFIEIIDDYSLHDIVNSSLFSFLDSSSNRMCINQSSFEGIDGINIKLQNVIIIVNIYIYQIDIIFFNYKDNDDIIENNSEYEDNPCSELFFILNYFIIERNYIYIVMDKVLVIK